MNSDASYVEESDERNSSPEPLIPSSPPPRPRPRPRPKSPRGQNINNALPLASTTTPAIVPSVTENLFAQGADAQTYFTRPNRYLGPASTWKSWTEEERTAALSLDRVRSQNLSLHLFNAFHLKRKADASARGRRPKKGGKGKARPASVASTTDDGGTFDGDGTARGRPTLPRAWTAWPMPPDRVPREDLLPAVKADGASRAKVDPRPSANLEEWLIGTALKFARERWNERQWAEEKSSVLQEQEDDDVDLGDADLELDHAPDAEESEAESALSEEGREEPGSQLFSSRGISVSDSSEGDTKLITPDRREGKHEVEEIDRRPVPLADDDIARQNFLPSARHILSRLDHLLTGLHSARAAYATKPVGKPRGRHFSRTPGDRPSTEAEEHGGSHSASRKRRRSSSVHSDVSSALNVPSRRTDRAERLGLRDWSDVVGMAALTGWDPAVVERASERCARLFGENMLFRTFHEGDGKATTPSWVSEHLAMDSASTTSLEAEQGEGLAFRTSAPCEACRQSKSRCQPAELQPEGTCSCQNCQETGRDCSGIAVQYNASAANGRCCPHESCPRHSIPFRKQYHLQRHLDTMHQNGGEEEKVPRRIPGSAAASTDVSDVDTDFGVSFGAMTAIFCPVPGCPRGKKPFREGRRLYEHVRRTHPDVDVDQVKDLEAKRRGERRGKWKDERRRRTRSASSRRSSSRSSRLRRESLRNEDDEGHGGNEMTVDR